MFYSSLTNISSGLTGLSNDILFYFVSWLNAFDRFFKCIDRLFIYFWTNDAIVEFHCS